VGPPPKASWECHSKTGRSRSTPLFVGTDPARDTEYEFLFVLGQSRFRGGVQSMINPVAIR
jgi:hypothetical protein